MHSLNRGRAVARLFVSTSAAALIGFAASPAAAQVSTTGDETAAQAQAQEGQPTANTSSQSTIQATNASASPTPKPVDAANSQTIDEPGAEQDIVVTGFRASLASSAKIKRNANLIVDSVSAEDVGKLPDVSIADSLARLPGVTAQRVEGRDQNLSIRGLGPDFSTTLLNGREQVTVGDNRGVEYDQYPSEFFQNVNVYKSADASLIAAGISGTVDLRMLRPLEIAGRVLAVAGRAQMNSIGKLNPDGERYGYRGSATYIDKFADNTLGIALGAAVTSAPTNYEKYEAWGYAGSGTSTDPYILGGAKPYVQSNLLKRYGGVATIEWEPSDNFHSTFDALYTNFTDTQRLRGIEFPLGYNTTATNVTDSDNFVTSATLSPTYTVQRNDYQRRKANTLALGWNNDFRFTDKIHLNVDASWSRAKRTDFLLETYTGTGYNGSGVRDTVKIARKDNGTYSIVPTLNYADTSVFKITDPGGWGYNGTQAVVQAGFLNQPKFKDDLKSLRASLNGEIDSAILKSWEIGGNYSRRRKTSAYTSYFLCPKGTGTNCTVASGTPTSLAVPADVVLDKQVSLDFLGVPQMLTLNPLGVYRLLNPIYDNRPDSIARDNYVLENVYTGYAKLNIDGTLGDKVVKGSVGLQVVHTKQSSAGNVAALNGGVVTVTPVAGSDSYTKFLPSGTLSIELMQNFYVKMGAAQTMVRPRLDQERITQAASLNLANVGRGSLPQNSPFSSNGGNIELRPYQSTNIDLSLEKYFDQGGYISAAGYFKNLTDYVDPNNSYLYDFSGLLPALTPAQRAIVVAQNAQFGLVSAPANTGRGYLLGSEVTASLPFKLFTEALDGFGVFASGSYTESSIKYANSPAAITLPGLSKWVGNATLFFEKYGFQARASYRYRSKFLAEVSGISATRETNTAKAEGILDAQVGYEFQSGFLKGLSILAQAKNLTNEPFQQYLNNDPRQVRRYQRYGRDYFLGLTYKF